MQALWCALILCFMAPMAMEAKEPIDDIQVFWPPDMVPHPTPPWDGPSDDEPEMA